MKNTPAWVIVAVIIVWAFILFWTFVYGLKRSFKTAPPPPRSDAVRMLREQRERNADMLEQQKFLTEQRQQRLKDLQKK